VSDKDKDLTNLLDSWPYGDGPSIRKISGVDGREKIQVRVCIDSFHGILQFESDGRPDGARPHSREFLLDHLEDKYRKHMEKGGVPEQYRLTHSQCKKIFEESQMLYHRYVILLQIGDYPRVVRDTTRNMRLFRFVHEHALQLEDRNHLECWWPYILRIHHTAMAMQNLGEGGLEKALEELTLCRKRLKALEPQDNETFQTELERSTEALDQMEKELLALKPESPVDKLEKEKLAAIAAERYEEAARLRDKISDMKAHPEAYKDTEEASEDAAESSDEPAEPSAPEDGEEQS